MITFSILHKKITLSGRAQYISEENSFFYSPWNNVDFSITIGNGYNSLDVDLKTGRILQLTGLNPRNRWIEKEISTPKAQPGNLLVQLDSDYTQGTGIQYANDWHTYFNMDTGWVCIGSTKYSNNSQTVMFANNSIAAISNGTLCSVWIKPYFV